jgi:membrane protein YqaA with SNARE-associated domain
MILASILISVVIIYFRNELAKLSSFGYLGIFLISILGSATLVIPSPTLVATYIGGSILNPIIVGLLSGLGTALGETTGYLAGLGGTEFIKENKNYRRVEKWMNKSGFLTIFILGIIPNPLFDFAGIFSGATKYPFKKFMLATILGKTIRFIGIALLGNSFL